MTEFKYFHSIEVRYGDLDPQGHVNNAKYLTYMEQIRVAFTRETGMWSGGSFLELGVIVAEIQITYLAPIRLGNQLKIGLRVSHLGNKSFHMEYTFVDEDTGQEFATGSSVQVAYDYHKGQTIPIPENWREILENYQ